MTRWTAFLVLLSATHALAGCNDGDTPVEDGTQVSELGTGPSAPYDWHTVRMGGTGYVTGVLAHPAAKGLYYARTDVGGAYRWDPSTASWVQLLDWVDAGKTAFYGVDSLSFDPSNAQKVYALVGTHYWSGGSAVLRSANQGRSWQATQTYADGTGAQKPIYAHGNGAMRGSGEKIGVDPKNGNILFVGTRRDGLLKSTDGGVSFKAVTSLPVTTTADDNGIAFVAFAPVNEVAGTATRTLFVGVSRTGATNLYKSTDGGNTWLPVSGAPTTATPYRGIVSGSRLFVTYNKPAAAPAGLGVLRFDVNTGAYTDLTPNSCYACFSDAVRTDGGVNQAASWAGIDVDRNNPQRLVVSTSGYYFNQQKGLGWGDRVMVSTDGGVSWKNGLDNRITFDNNGIPFGNGHAAHWANAIALDPFDSKRLMVVSGHGLLASTDLTDGSGPTNWRFDSKGIEEGVFYDAVSLPNGRLVSSMLDYDGFTHLDPAVYADSARGYSGGTAMIAAAELAPQLVVKVNRQLLLSTDSGTGFVELPRPTAAAGGSAALSAAGTTILYRPAGSTVFYTSQDRGVSWRPATGLVLGTLTGREDRGAFRVFADGADDKTFYFLDRNNTADGPGGQLWIGTVGSAGVLTFAKGGVVAANRAGIPRAVPGVRGQVYVPLGNAGVAFSTDGGKTFKALASVADAGALSFGPPADCGAPASMFIHGLPASVKAADAAAGVPSTPAMYRSDDGGATWVQVEDAAHRFGSLANGGFITADRRVFGRVFRSSAGRGIPYGEPAQGSLPISVKACLSTAQAASGGALDVRAQSYGIVERTAQLTFELEGAQKTTRVVDGDQRFDWRFWALAPGNYRVRATATHGGATTVGGWSYFRYNTPTHNLAVNNPWLRNAYLTFELPSTFKAGTAVSLNVQGNGVNSTFGPDSAPVAGINYARIPVAKNFAPGTYTVTLSVGGAVVATIKATKYGG